jgi:hypothetical protein
MTGLLRDDAELLACSLESARRNTQRSGVILALLGADRAIRQEFEQEFLSLPPGRVDLTATIFG